MVIATALWPFPSWADILGEPGSRHDCAGLLQPALGCGSGVQLL